MFQLSLRSLLILVALVALAIVSLRFASNEWQIVTLGIAAGLLCGAIILALTSHARRRAFATGFAIAMLLYGLTVLGSMSAAGGLANKTELNPDTGRLPTTWLLRPIFHRIATIGWVDLRTGDGVPFSTPVIESDPNAAHFTMGELPSREVFMTIGHLWWSIFAGLCGGTFAEWLYVRRQRKPLGAG